MRGSSGWAGRAATVSMRCRAKAGASGAPESHERRIMKSHASRLLAVLCLAWMGIAAGGQDVPRTAGPYVPTPQVIVDRMLQMAQVGPKDFVVDLGSGDGRMVRTAAKALGASGFGVDIDSELVELSNQTARREGIANRAMFYEQDVFKSDVRK